MRSDQDKDVICPCVTCRESVHYHSIPTTISCFPEMFPQTYSCTISPSISVPVQLLRGARWRHMVRERASKWMWSCQMTHTTASQDGSVVGITSQSRQQEFRAFGATNHEVNGLIDHAPSTSRPSKNPTASRVKDPSATSSSSSSAVVSPP
ncbi:hypothetical protein BJ742DRAFT_841508 [Cladochytrium replicatum]|nr:hypothetical protein BJ742DRAFT_841508 [Cladochytrium replicatum]